MFLIKMKRKTKIFSLNIKRTFSTNFSSKNIISFTKSTPKSNFSFKSSFKQISPMEDPEINNKHFDVAVIGGGSGGLSFAYVIKINYFFFYLKII